MASVDVLAVHAGASMLGITGRSMALRVAVTVWATLSSVCASAQSSPRVVTLGGGVTEVVYALGAGQQVVGTDQSSLYPKQATELPRVGYYRMLPLEGVAQLKPTLVLASEHAGPPHVMAQLSALGITVHRISDQATIESLYQRIRQIAPFVATDAAGQSLIDHIKGAYQHSQSIPVRKRSAMVVVMRSATLLGAGNQTHAHAILNLTGLDNVLHSFDSYQPLTPESVSALAPEVIITTSTTVQASGGLAKLTNHPALIHTPAARQNRFIVLDDMLVQGLGPRFPQAITQIRRALLEASSNPTVIKPLD